MYIDLHDDRRTRFRKDAPHGITLAIGSEKSTQGCQGLMATLVTSDDLVRLCQITMVKRRSQKRPALIFA